MIFNDSSNGIVPTDKVPLLEYKFPVTITKPDGVELIDYGKGHSNGKLYFGRGLKLNGVDQSFTVNTQGATHLYYFLNGELQELDVTSIDSKEFTAEGVYQNAISTSKQFTAEQVAYLKAHPEKFLYSVAEIQEDGSKTYSLHSEILTQYEIDSVVAYLPMCETDSFLSTFTPTSLELLEIDGFIEDMRAVNLTYGLQTCFLKRDSDGVPYDSSFNVIQHDGIGYIDTNYIPDGVYTVEEVVEIDGHTTHILYNENGSKITNGTDVETYTPRTDKLVLQKSVDGEDTAVHRAFRVVDKEIDSEEAYKEALRTVFPLLIDSDGYILLDSDDNYLTA